VYPSASAARVTAAMHLDAACFVPSEATRVTSATVGIASSLRATGLESIATQTTLWLFVSVSHSATAHAKSPPMGAWWCE
jgi:hypothetical protein